MEINLSQQEIQHILDKDFYHPFLEEIKKELDKRKSKSTDELAGDESFWQIIRNQFLIHPELINLNNGGVSPQPFFVQEMQFKLTQFFNQLPSYYNWVYPDLGREEVRKMLAKIGGCDAEEIAICRNTTEAYANVVLGLDLKAGDEIILSEVEYPNMINTWKLRAERDNLKLVWLHLDLPQENVHYFINKYINSITEKTRVVHLGHMINWIGQLMPVKEIVQAIRKKKNDVEIVLDSAHTFAQFEFSFHDLDCDYAGVSLQKWLNAPFGTGLFYVKKEKIKSLLPIFAGETPHDSDIRKFEVQGTRSFATEIAIGFCCRFHQLLTTKLKRKRLLFLRDYWINKVKHLPKLKLHSPLHPDFSGTLCAITIDGMAQKELEEVLLKKYKIHAVGFDVAYLHAVRITPGIYTSLKELDQLVNAITELAS
jgi:selenocysteine lyase/cysteine desulfurase